MLYGGYDRQYYKCTTIRGRDWEVLTLALGLCPKPDTGWFQVASTLEGSGMCGFLWWLQNSENHLF